MRRLRTLLAAVLVSGCTVAGTIAGAVAAPLEHPWYEHTDTFTFDDCGFPIAAVTTFRGLFILPSWWAGDPTPYVLNIYDAGTVYTNSGTGARFTISGKGLHEDLRLSRVSGTIYRLDAMEVGRPFQVRDSAGRPVIVDRGRLLYTALLDTKGDADPGNDDFLEGTFQVLAGNGAHPGSSTDPCDIANDLIG